MASHGSPSKFSMEPPVIPDSGSTTPRAPAEASTAVFNPVLLFFFVGVVAAFFAGVFFFFGAAAVVFFFDAAVAFFFGAAVFFLGAVAASFFGAAVAAGAVAVLTRERVLRRTGAMAMMLKRTTSTVFASDIF